MRRVEIDVGVHRLIERHRRSFSETANDILERILPLVPVPAASFPSCASIAGAEPVEEPSASPSAGAAARGPPLAVALDPSPPGSRRRGQWVVELCGERLAAANLLAAYRTLLEALDLRHPGFLDAFAEQRSRYRRFIARSPSSLYEASPHLAKRHAAPLAAGWYLDSNVSTTQVARRARIAARLCGLRYGSEVRILENLREI